MIEKCDCFKRPTMSDSTARNAPVVVAAAALGRSSSRRADQFTPLYVVSQCVRPMMLHALSKVTNGSVTGDDANEVDTAPAAGPQAARIGGSMDRLGARSGVAGDTRPRHAPNSEAANSEAASNRGAVRRSIGITRWDEERGTDGGTRWSRTLDEYDRR